MPTVSLKSAVLTSYKSQIVEVEVKVSNKGDSLNFQIIGLADSAVREAKERVYSALQNSGFKVPSKILVNLAPADLKKEGASCDVAIAIGILVASGQIDYELIDSRLFIGELALDGRVKGIRAAVAHCLEAYENKINDVVLPYENLNSVSCINKINYIPSSCLIELIQFLKNEKDIPITSYQTNKNSIFKTKKLSDVKGQSFAKRGMLIAAAGGHNILFIGSPGCGKSMLAERFQCLLPPIKEEELFSTLRLHSIADLPIEPILNGSRPFRSPHHSISQAGLIGGGSSPKPGEISLAHNGVLFLDEFPEYKRQAIEALRAPLENNTVNISRAKGSAVFPANFQLIAAMNPCPCGRLGLKDKQCLCSPRTIYNYLKKISQPILDRIDIQIDLKPVPIEEVQKDVESESDEELKLRVIKAREKAISRQGRCNSMLDNKTLIKSLEKDIKAKSLLDKYAKAIKMSLRSYFRIAKLAITISDLDETDYTKEKHISEALSFRGLDTIESYLSL